MSLGTKVNGPVTPFQMISPLSNNRGRKQPDIFDRIVHLKPATQVMFIELKRHRNYVTNVCSYELSEDLSDKNSSAYKLFSRRTVELRDAGILVRLDAKARKKLGLGGNKNHYLLNPSLIHCKENELAKKIWSTQKTAKI